MLALFAGSGGCRDEAPPAGATLTYWQDVAPVFRAKCLRCHQDGGIGGLRLDDYQPARQAALAAAAATHAGLMPPFHIDTSGGCGQFEDGEALTAAERALIWDWANGDTLEGTPAPFALPSLPGLAEAASFVVPALPPPAAPGSGAGEQGWCFPIAHGRVADGFITGHEVVAAAGALEHAFVFVIDPERSTAGGRSNRALLEELGRGGGLGGRWPCAVGGAGAGLEAEATLPVFTPRQGPVSYPAGTGVPLPATARLVLQIHRPAVAGADTETPTELTLRLRFAAQVERRLVVLSPDGLLGARGDRLPPGQKRARVSWTQTLAQMGLPGPEGADLVAVLPHMHRRGRRFELATEAAGTTPARCLARVERFYPAWQRPYLYAAGGRPHLRPDDALTVRCEYDTQAAVDPISPGFSAGDELCMASLWLALPAGR